MKKTLLICVLLGALALGASAQPSLAWEKVYSDSTEWAEIPSIIGADNGTMVFLNVVHQFVSGTSAVDNGTLTLTKIDSSGNILWQSASIPNFAASGLQKTQTGFVASGWTYVPKSIYEICEMRLVKFDTMGNVEWDQNYPSPDTNFRFEDYSFSTVSSAVSEGEKESIVAVSTLVQPESDTAIPIVFCIDNNDGSIEWQKTYKNLGWSVYILSMQPVSEGFAFSVNGSLQAIMKIDPSGNSVWVTSMPATVSAFCGTRGNGILAVTESGNIVLDQSTGAILNDSIGGGQSSIIIQRPDSSGFVQLGDFESVYSWGGSPYGIGSITCTDLSNEYVQGSTDTVYGTPWPSAKSYNINGVMVAPDGGYIITGNVSTTDLFSFSMKSFILKLKKGSLGASTVKQIGSAKSSIQIYPNPATSEFTIACERDWTATLVDMTGKTVQELSGTGAKEFEKGNIASGLYLISVKTDAGTRTVKILFQ